MEANAGTDCGFSVPRARLAWLMAFLAIFGITGLALGQEPVQPLKPLDRSSPRAALKAFLDSGDNLGALVDEYLKSPSRAGFHQAIVQGDVVLSGLNLSEIPVAARDARRPVPSYPTISRISASTLPPPSSTFATVTGREKRRGPAAPGFR